MLRSNRAYSWRRRSVPVIAGLLLCGSTLALTSVSANEITGNYAWQFRGVGDRALALQQLEAQQRRAAGAYGPNSYNYNTYIAGDQVNCSVSAQAVGNTGTTGLSGASSSPSLANVPNVFAQATGSSVASQGFPSAGGGTLSAPLNSAQTNTSSPQSASVSSTTSSLTSTGMNSSGGMLTQSVMNSQGNTNSPQTASVYGSTACGQAGSTR